MTQDRSVEEVLTEKRGYVYNEGEGSVEFDVGAYGACLGSAMLSPTVPLCSAVLIDSANCRLTRIPCMQRKWTTHTFA